MTKKEMRDKIQQLEQENEQLRKMLVDNLEKDIHRMKTEQAQVCCSGVKPAYFNPVKTNMILNPFVEPCWKGFI